MVNCMYHPNKLCNRCGECHADNKDLLRIDKGINNEEQEETEDNPSSS